MDRGQERSDLDRFSGTNLLAISPAAWESARPDRSGARSEATIRRRALLPASAREGWTLPPISEAGAAGPAGGPPRSRETAKSVHRLSGTPRSVRPRFHRSLRRAAGPCPRNRPRKASNSSDDVPGSDPDDHPAPRKHIESRELLGRPQRAAKRRYVDVRQKSGVLGQRRQPTQRGHRVVPGRPHGLREPPRYRGVIAHSYIQESAAVGGLRATCASSSGPASSSQGST